MISKTSLAPAVLAFALGAAAVQAQPTTDDPAGATPPDGNASAGESGAAAERSANSGDSPFDYRASEEISEDLPVSFPVDI